jgi:trimeric autotransporter adhesin
MNLKNTGTGKNMKDRLIAILLSILLFASLSSCGGGGGASVGSGASATPATLVSIEVTPADPVIALGTTAQLKATGIYSDNTKKDLTSSVEWDSTDSSVAAVHSGLARSIAQGRATIKAASGNITGSRTLTVTSAALVSIHVTPVNPNAALGTSTQFTATGIFSDDSAQDLTSQATWSSSTGSIASVSNAAGSRGLATSFEVGSTAISATLDSITGSTDLTVTPAVLVSIQVTPTNPGLAKGMTRQFTATGIYSDHSTQDLTKQATWSSSAATIASISNADDSRGLAASIEMGATAISATLDSVTGSTDLTVTPAVLVSIQVTPTNPGLAKGTTRQFTATGIYSDHSTQDLTKQVTWSSSSTSVASVSNAAGSNGLATALAVGTTGVGATLGYISGTTTLDVTAATLVAIEVSPADPSISKGTTRQFAATGIYTDASTQDLTKQVTWNSSDTSVASISNAAGSNGLASALGVGSATISATLGTVSGTTALGVTAATLVSIQVDPADSVISMDITAEFTATGIYSDDSTQDLTQQVTWKSSDDRVASISNADDSRGLATPAGAGSSTIYAILGDAWGSTTLTVSKASLVSIEVTPDRESILSGKTLQLTATGHYSDGMTLDVTKSAVWKSSDNKVVKVSNAKKERGLATSGQAGKATVTATLSKVSGSATLTVSE